MKLCDAFLWIQSQFRCCGVDTLVACVKHNNAEHNDGDGDGDGDGVVLVLVLVMMVG